MTPEGEVVSWADRIAYVCHDFEDAVAAGIVIAGELPAVVLDRCGERRAASSSARSSAAMVGAAARSTGRIGMTTAEAEALGEFRRFNYERVYLRPASREQATAVIDLLRALVEHYAANPALLPDAGGADPAARRGRLRRRHDRPLRLPSRSARPRLGPRTPAAQRRRLTHRSGGRGSRRRTSDPHPPTAGRVRFRTRATRIAAHLHPASSWAIKVFGARRR